MPTVKELFESACRIHTNFLVLRYLMCNTKGRLDGFEKADNHKHLCEFYVAMYYGIEPDDVGRLKLDVYKLVHDGTQELTDNLDEVIGFPLDRRPDYDRLAPKFFKVFHKLAMDVLEKSEQTS